MSNLQLRWHYYDPTTADFDWYAQIDDTGLACIYDFSGFFGTIKNPPQLNRVFAGRAIPVIFSLNGNRGLDIFADDYPASQEIDCTTLNPIGPLTPTNTPGNSGLSYHAGTDLYNYPWQTDNSWAGTCRQLVVRLDDGTDHIANFQFRP
jgi:hypothetical protein